MFFLYSIKIIPITTREQYDAIRVGINDFIDEEQQKDY